MTDPKDEIIKEVDQIFVEEAALQVLEKEMQAVPEVAKYLEAQRKFQTSSALYWKAIENGMMSNNIKSIKGDWGNLTIAERTNYVSDLELLQPKFTKKVADTTKITASVKLTGDLPKGVTTTTTHYLMKRLKAKE